jgi:ectoine hydroxylase-related dioxygenase (phytanoyl-CoA dioxygenase family)
LKDVFGHIKKNSTEGAWGIAYDKASANEVKGGKKKMWRSAVAERGFAIITGVLAEAEISRLADTFARISLQRSRAGVRHALGDAAVYSLARQAPLQNMARDILGTAEAIPFRATLFDKSPSANWLVVWHQDTALPLREQREMPGWGPWSLKAGIVYAHAPANALDQVVALRIHLDDSTALNGPLRVLPETHRKGVLSDEEIHQLAAEVAPVACLVPRGGVLAMRPLLVHASSKSQSTASRRVLHIEYAGSKIIEEGLELAVV